MLDTYIVKFAIRIAVFLTILLLYLFQYDALAQALSDAINNVISPLHILWLMFMIMMLRHLLPRHKATMALLKGESEYYHPVPNYAQEELDSYIHTQNRRALLILILWIAVNSIFGVLHASSIMKDVDLFMLTIFYFLCDYICILIYCPFQALIMQNKCCVNCRIFDWGHFMMFLPMLFIPSAFTWSLFFMSLIVLLRWEWIVAKHPERIWSGSHKRLQCANCTDKTCQIKTKLNPDFRKRVTMPGHKTNQ